MVISWLIAAWSAFNTENSDLSVFKPQDKGIDIPLNELGQACTHLLTDTQTHTVARCLVHLKGGLV